MPIHFCSLASGSSGNSQFIASDHTRLLLDAGLSGKYITNSLDHIGESLKDIDALLITHEHSDHIKGAGVIYRKIKRPIYATQATWAAMQSKLGEIAPEHIRIIQPGESFEIGDIQVKPIAISHDAADPVAYAFGNLLARMCVATDLGHCPESVQEEFLECDLLMLESNHDVNMLKIGPYPYYLKRRILSDVGHLSNETAAMVVTRAVKEGRVRSVLLGHLSKENNLPELAYETVGSIVSEAGIRIGEDINLDLTYRDRVGMVYHIRK